MANKRIYRFSKTYTDGAEVHGDPKMILGGKGWSLQQMCKLGLPVPPGFTITTEVCNEYREADAPGQEKLLTDLLNEAMKTHVQELKKAFGFMPLVSVRSGAAISMPGMMDTILNVGLTDKTLPEWQKRIGDKPALDSYRRLIHMLGSTAFGIDDAKFEFQLASIKKQEAVETDQQLSKKALQGVIIRYKNVFKENTGTEFPQDLNQQLGFAIRAVFDSWQSERAVEYRKLNGISEDLGTACTIQAMVFGNMGDDSGSGVLFTRDPSTGDNVILAEYLANAQGEDVVAGIRTPDKLVIDTDTVVSEKVPWKVDLAAACQRLEEAYLDMVDLEFTVQKGELFILQSRVGKRSARAAFKIAVDLVEEQKIEIETALKRLTVDQFRAVRRPGVDPNFDVQPQEKGLATCPGVAVGKPVFSAEDAINCTEPCILVRHETMPDDIAGMAKAVGILTKTGGATSHAAVVARAMDKPCVVGCEGLDIEVLQATAEKVTICGTTGRVWVNHDVPVVDVSNSPEVKTVMQWCMDQMGAVEASLLDKPEDVPHRIIAAQWWGDENVLDVVLDSLTERENRKGVVLDFTPPWAMKHPADKLLDEAFSLADKEDVDFYHKVVHAVTVRAHKLSGLTIVGHFGGSHDLTSGWKKHGVMVPAAPKTVADLMGAYVATPSTDFIENVCGGTEAYEKLRRMMLDAGYSLSVVPDAVPPEYAAFTVLGKAG